MLVYLVWLISGLLGVRTLRFREILSPAVWTYSTIIERLSMYIATQLSLTTVVFLKALWLFCQVTEHHWEPDSWNRNLTLKWKIIPVLKWTGAHGNVTERPCARRAGVPIRLAEGGCGGALTNRKSLPLGWVSPRLTVWGTLVTLPDRQPGYN